MKKALVLDGNLTLLAIRKLKIGEVLAVTEEQYRGAAESVIDYAKRKKIGIAVFQDLSMSRMKMVMLGVVTDLKSEDSGQARIAVVDKVGSSEIFARLQSWDESCEHKDFESMGIKVGTRVRIDVE